MPGAGVAADEFVPAVSAWLMMTASGCARPAGLQVLPPPATTFSVRTVHADLPRLPIDDAVVLAGEKNFPELWQAQEPAAVAASLTAFDADCIDILAKDLELNPDVILSECQSVWIG